MNRSIIRYILGCVLKIEAAFMLLPCIVSVIYGEHEGLAFLISALACFAVGSLMSFRKPYSNVFHLKESFIMTALSWIFMSIFGALPFVISGEIPSFTNALFETVSGFTTTGSSILTDVEALSHCALFWRSFTHLIGGMGVLVFLLAIVPLSGGSNFNLMRAESTGPSVGKLVPKVKHTARILYIIYLGMVFLEFIFLIVGRMPLFDAITTAFSTAGTGGFGIKNDSLMSYSPYIQWVVTIFMILFGVNFNVYYLIIYKKVKQVLKLEEVKYYFLIVFGAIAVIFINIVNTSSSIFKALTDASFQVASIISTSGFSTADFDLWPELSKTILVLLMFIGACAGSTGGGIKVSRILIMIKSVFKEFSSVVYPKSVKKININDKPVEHNVVRSVNVYFISFIVLYAVSLLLITLDNFDFTTNFTAIIASLNNIGPGLNLVGPTMNYSIFSAFSKYVLMFDMLAGRLELFPMLILVQPTILKEMVLPRKKK